MLSNYWKLARSHQHKSKEEKKKKSSHDILARTINILSLKKQKTINILMRQQERNKGAWKKKSEIGGHKEVGKMRSNVCAIIKFHDILEYYWMYACGHYLYIMWGANIIYWLWHDRCRCHIIPIPKIINTINQKD